MNSSDRYTDAAKNLNAFLRRYSRPPEADGSLDGLSFAVKDLFAVAGNPLTFGLDPPVIDECVKDAALVSKLLRCGASLAGSTNLDEACCTARGTNRHFGSVINPTDTQLCPLGSSSGSAAVVAADLVDFALGSDFSGSTRAPAAACAIWGLKTTPDGLPRQGCLLISQTMDSIGVLAKSPDVLSRVMTALLAADRSFDGAGCRLFTLEDESICRSLCIRLQAMNFANSLAAEILHQAANLHRLVAAVEFYRFISEINRDPEYLHGAAQALFIKGSQITEQDLSAATRQKDLLSSQFAQHFKDGSLLITPTLAGIVPSADDVHRNRVDLALLLSFLPVANLLSLPALAFPSPWDPTFSLQLVGPPHSEMRLLHAAATIHTLYPPPM